MRTVVHPITYAFPAVLAVLLLALFSTPLQIGGISLTPNVAWVMSLIVAAAYPPAWPRGFAFLLGLAQDVLFATPLGAQALLTLLLVQLVRSQARRQNYQLFRIRWLEAAGVLVVWHALLWAVLHMVAHDAASLRSLLIAGIISAAWYPVFYLPMTRLLGLLPPIKH